jgi:hypothetical protein
VRRKTLVSIWELFRPPLYWNKWISPTNGKETVTRDLVATIRHLRYYSGSVFFFTRGLILYLFWYHVALSIFELATTCAVLLPILLVYWIISWFHTFDTNGESFFATFHFEVLVGVVKIAYFGLASEQIAIHTM